MELIGEAEEMMKSDPQKALSILDSVRFFPYLNPKYKRKLKFINIYANYELKRDISVVQGLDKLAKAFESEGDWYRASWTNFFNANTLYDISSGKVLQKGVAQLRIKSRGTEGTSDILRINM